MLGEKARVDFTFVLRQVGVTAAGQMTMAAPVAFAGSGKNGVSVGTSFSALPSAPGAPSGQSGNELVGCAWATAKHPNRVIKARRVFIGTGHYPLQ